MALVQIIFIKIYEKNKRYREAKSNLLPDSFFQYYAVCIFFMSCYPTQRKWDLNLLFHNSIYHPWVLANL